MCGAIALEFEKVSEKELREFFTAAEIEEFRQKGEILFAFWARRPVLPVREEGGIHLYDWGNRDPNLKLPKTGWAKIESVLKGKWNYLKPIAVSIPARRGSEKKVWFEITKDIEGVLVEYQGEKRVYMITREATQDYRNLTRHDRMPVFKKCA